MIEIDLQWRRLCALTQTMTVTKLNEKEQGTNYTLMLNDLRHDRITSTRAIVGSASAETVTLGLYRAPASKDRHHDREGGLVQHLLEMWELWPSLREAIREQTTLHAHLCDQNIWRAILHHDLNKVWRYRLVTANPWAVDYAEDRMTALLTAQGKSLWLLAKYDIKLDLPLTNALLASEGGYAKTRVPVETVLAKVVYLLDELSANVVDRLNVNRFWDSKRGGFGEIP